MKILVDIMGSDLGPGELLSGVCDAAQEFPDVSLSVIGQRSVILTEAEKRGLSLNMITILDAPDVILMEDQPVSVIREKNHSSMANGLRALAHGEADAFVSAGNTGALIMGGTMIVRRQRGISRPAIGTLFPFKNPVFLLDAGANIEVTPEFLSQFAILGSLFYRLMFGVEQPRIGLLNNGTEEEKGTPVHIATNKLLSEMKNINFVGNVEAKSVPYNACDVLISDGFSGNLFLKTVEGMSKYLSGEIKAMFKSNFVGKICGLLMKKKFVEFKESFSATKHGGSPILGLRYPVIKAHGSSDAQCIKAAIRQAINFVKTDFSAESEKFLNETPLQ